MLVCVCEQFYVVLILQLAFCNLRDEDQMDAPSPLSVVVGAGCAGVDGKCMYVEDKGVKWKTSKGRGRSTLSLVDNKPINVAHWKLS